MSTHLRCSSIGSQVRSSLQTTIGIQACLLGFLCPAYPWSWAFRVSGKERQLVPCLRPSRVRRPPAGSPRRLIQRLILLLPRHLLVPCPFLPLGRTLRPLNLHFLRRRRVLIQRRILPIPSLPIIHRPSVDFPRLPAILLIVAPTAILRRSRRPVPSILLEHATRRVAAHLTAGAVVLLHVLGIVRAPRVRG